MIPLYVQAIFLIVIVGAVTTIILFWIRKEMLYQASINNFMSLLQRHPSARQVQENWEQTRGEIYAISEVLIEQMPSRQKQIIRNLTFDELTSLLEETFQGMPDTRQYEIQTKE